MLKLARALQMNYIKGWAIAARDRYAYDHLSRRSEVFASIMSHFAHVTWHYRRMYECFSQQAYDLACYHSSCVKAYYENFPVLFCDLRFNSRSDTYCTILQGLIDYNASYLESAEKIISDSHDAIFASLSVPSYVTITVEIEMREDESDIDCGDEDWVAYGKLLCNYHLLHMRPIRPVGELYYQRAVSIANTLSTNDAVHSAFGIAHKLDEMRALLVTLTDVDHGQQVFDIERGYMPRVEAIL